MSAQVSYLDERTDESDEDTPETSIGEAEDPEQDEDTLETDLGEAEDPEQDEPEADVPKKEPEPDSGKDEDDYGKLEPTDTRDHSERIGSEPDELETGENYAELVTTRRAKDQRASGESSLVEDESLAARLHEGERQWKTYDLLRELDIRNNSDSYPSLGNGHSNGHSDRGYVAIDTFKKFDSNYSFQEKTMDDYIRTGDSDEHISTSELERRLPYFERLWIFNHYAHVYSERGFEGLDNNTKSRWLKEDPVISGYETEIKNIEKDIERLERTIRDNELPSWYTKYDLAKALSEIHVTGYANRLEKLGKGLSEDKLNEMVERDAKDTLQMIS